MWQAYALLNAGFSVRVIEKSRTPFDAAASNLAGAMLAPYCECEPSEKLLLSLGIQSLELWRASPFEIKFDGTLVLTSARDAKELDAFAKRTTGHCMIDGTALQTLEPDLASRFSRALFYEGEAHLAPRKLLSSMLCWLEEQGVEFEFGRAWNKDHDTSGSDFIIDCRGMGAQHEIEGLRAVRGEMAVIRCSDLQINRPVRLLHPRMPCYIVPWPDDQYMVGATVIESDDGGPVTLRSVLELLGSAFSVHPGFGEARVIEFSAGLRPAFSDNMPQISLKGNIITVNGVYRNGFLLGPLLGAAVASYIETGKKELELFQ